MSEHRYWFEEIPEEERYWFLAPSGPLPSFQARRDSEAQESGLTPQDAEDLRNVESDIQHASVFHSSEEQARKIREETAEMRERLGAAGYGDLALEPPAWPTVFAQDVEEGWDKVHAPILYTEREKAEEAARELEAEETEGYLQLVESHGQADADDAWDNYVPFKPLWVDRSTLLDKLEDSTFLCVMVDGVLKLRQDYVEQLRAEDKEEG